MAHQTARWCALILIICFPMFQCHPVPADGNSKVTSEKSVPFAGQPGQDKLGNRDSLTDNDFRAGAEVALETAPVRAETSSILTRRNVFTESSRPTSLGRSNTPAELVPISKGSLNSSTAIVKTSIASSAVPSRKPLKTNNVPSTRNIASPTMTEELEEFESSEDYSIEFYTSAETDLFDKKTETASVQAHPSSSSSIALSTTKVADPSRGQIFVTATGTKTSSDTGSLQPSSVNLATKSTVKSEELVLSSPKEASTLKPLPLDELPVSKVRDEPIFAIANSAQRNTEEMSAFKTKNRPLQMLRESTAASKMAPNTEREITVDASTFNPSAAPETTVKTSMARPKPTTTLPIEVKQPNTVAFQQAQQPSITASFVPLISDPIRGQQVNFAPPAAQQQPMTSPTFTQTNGFARPAGPPAWPENSPAQAITFGTQASFATAHDQATHQNNRVQSSLSNLPQPLVPAPMFQHPPVASDQQQMALNGGNFAQPVPHRLVSPSSALNRQPVNSVIGQPILIRTNSGLSQANFLPASLLRHFVPTFKSLGIRIVLPTLTKPKSR